MFDQIFAVAIPPEAIPQTLTNDLEISGNYLNSHKELLLRTALSFLIIIAAAAILYWSAGKLLDKWRKHHPERKNRAITTLFAPLLALAVTAALFAALIPASDTLPAGCKIWITRIFAAAAALIVTWGLLRLAVNFDRKLRDFANRDDNTMDNLTAGIIGSLLKIVIIVMATFFIGQNIFDLNLTALLASAGVLGLACALAAKDTVSNFFGTLVIIADAPFKTGDRIECGQVCGIVKNVGMRSTRLITDDESVCTIPNSMLTNAVLMQRNRRGHFKRIIDLTLTYDTTPEQIEMAIAILHQLMDDFHGKDQKGFEPRIFFSGFGAYSLNIRAIIFFKTESFLQEEKFLHELNHAILKQFNAANLEFAYPTQTLYFSDQNNTK